ncbi:hypothetical protein EDD18DRAFT_1366165 [Armillaria luteobubalina]|uniref:Uncharacterized protein n=1 Tax=Armillaria luteobubalina TaxID=153913 RepID=A0AA39U358_9AGAR|nr:hypothetical protein EDD18DRAFT_1366165 [Armillaria luteobubalina]
MSMSIFSSQQLPTSSKTVHHPAILSVYHDCLRTDPKSPLPKTINNLEMTREFGENANVTHDDVEYASNVVLTVHGYFASLQHDPKHKRDAEFIAEMYQFAVKNAYIGTTWACGHAPPADWKNEIEGLEGKIGKLKIDITSCASSQADLSTTNNAQIAASNAQTTANTAENIALNAENIANNAQTTANTAQAIVNNATTTADNAEINAKSAQNIANIAQITAKNVIIADLNGHRRYQDKFSMLRKVTSKSGLNLAQEVRPPAVKETDLKYISPAPTVGATPRQWDGWIAKYTNKDILKMIIFYNNNFGIALEDNLTQRIDKFRSFLLDCGEL